MNYPVGLNNIKIISGLKAKEFLLTKFPENTFSQVALVTDLILTSENFKNSEAAFRKCNEFDSLLQLWVQNGNVLAIVFAYSIEDELKIRLLSISNLLRMQETSASVLTTFLRLAHNHGFKNMIFPLYPDTQTYFQDVESSLKELGWTYDYNLDKTEILLVHS